MILSLSVGTVICAATNGNQHDGGTGDAEALQQAPLNPNFVAYWENPPKVSYGDIPPTMDLSHIDAIPVKGVRTADTLPSRFDWRDSGKVTPVKNQNPCGTCWAFGATSALESAVLMDESAEYNFSEQSVALCVDRSWVYLYDDPTDPCMTGGNCWRASEVFIKKGSVLESCNPYDCTALNCDGSCVCDDCQPVKKVDGFRVSAWDGSQINTIKNAILNKGPAKMSYYHNDTYVYSDPTWGTIHDYYPCPEGTNHAVSIVGWDDDVPHPCPGHSGTGAWIVKNSWGTGWGNGGYFYLAYGSSCVERIIHLEYKDHDPTEELLYWDEAGQVTDVGYEDGIAWMASVFTADQPRELTHVDFYTTSNNAEYEIYVWDGYFGSEITHQTGTCQECGYYSIPLNTPILIGAGQQFTVGVNMTTPGYGYPIPAECKISGDVDPPIQAGVSFIRHFSSSSWADLADYGCNAGLRARMASEPLPENTKWVQLPDLTPNGIDIKVDDERVLADDFECTFPSLLTDVHFWGSWKFDEKGEIENIHLSIHSDDPVGEGGTNPDNQYSMPDELLWKGDFGPDEFEEMLYHTMPDGLYEWWWDPVTEKLIQNGDTQVWQYNIRIDPDEAFHQNGSKERPVIYWLDISVKTNDGDFGWKTRQWPEHFMDDAVYWDGLWQELRYPQGHELEGDSIDMAFMLTFEEAVHLDWGDAPDNASAPGYPTLAVNNGANHVIAGPWLGNQTDNPDAEPDGQPDPNALGDDLLDGNDDEDGVSIPPLVAGQNAFITVEGNGGGAGGFVDAWIDFDSDRTWQAGEHIFAGWLSDGVHTIPSTVPMGSVPGPTFARFRISSQGGLPSVGFAPDGEVEDHEVWIEPLPENTKWVQLPDLTPNGIDIKVDDGRVLADDFECTFPSLLTDVHFWGSWKNDRKGNITDIILSIRSDDPAGPGGTNPDNEYSMPDELLWACVFGPDEFEEMLYHVAPEGEWWWDPITEELIQHGDEQVWRYDIKIDPEGAFRQNGSEERPIIYWLDISVETESEECEFGWKTRKYPDHFMDDAVYRDGLWMELRYPPGHPYHETYPNNSIDMSFMLTFEGEASLDWGDAPDNASAPGYPTLASSNGARHVIVPGFHLGRTIRVSQESSPGAGDFDANILGYVSPYVTANTTAGYYQYGTPYGASFNGPAPALTSDRSHLFLADTADGLSLFVVHDKPVDGSGGTTTMRWTLAGDMAGVLVLDDPGESVTVSGGGTIFDSSHSWAQCCTDGMAFGSLDGGWTMIGAFTNAISSTGMNAWHIYASDGSSIPLALETNRRVRLDYQYPIDPEPDGQPHPYALGDDNGGNDDENGVVFNTPLVPGKPAQVTVTASANGRLQGWIDFDADSSWADPGEQIFADQSLAAGTNVLTFNVPATAAIGRTFARFRFSTMPGLPFDGPAPDGEVEDYMVRIRCDCGDVDCSGTVNIMDVRLLMNHVADPTGYPVDSVTGNVDGVGGIDMADVQLLVAHVFNPAGHPLNCDNGI
jgi:C1A family cysteine protease